MKNKGFQSVLLLVLTTIFIWISIKIEMNAQIPTLRLITQIAGLLGAVFLSLEYILATRLKFLENLFDGLDTLYKYHHWMGITGYSLIFAHLTSLLISGTSNSVLLSIYLIPGEQTAYSFGILAFYVFTTLIFVTLFLKLPYNLWKLTHNLMGIPLFLGVLHMLLISSDISQSTLLRIWMFSITGVALVAYIYKRFFYGFLSTKFKIKRINDLGEVVELTLAPIAHKISFIPGQYVFISIRNQNVSSEIHPFTISSDNNNELIRISAKKSGDYTSNLGKLKAGDQVDVWGPYGTFAEKFNSAANQIWIGGGIGITPFLSRLNSMQTNDRNITLFYTYRSNSGSNYISEIQDLTSRLGIKLKLYCSEKDQRLQVEDIEKELDTSKKNNIYICGPKGLTKKIIQHFPESSKIKVYFELFEMYS